MNKFPSLGKWFDVRLDVSNSYKYTRYDLCIRCLSDENFDELSDELALLIARLRLRQKEYKHWLRYWKNSIPIPLEWVQRFKDRFWRSFVSTEATKKADGKIEFDELALQGYLGELMLYLIQFQHYEQRICAVPKKPKDYSKDSGIDCLELCGFTDKPDSLHYIIWECKGLTSATLKDYPNKIYNQHLHETPKTFAEMVDLLADIYDVGDKDKCIDNTLGDFVDEMIDDFYSRPPSRRKCYGGCVSYSGKKFARSDAFSTFGTRFRNDLAEHNKCRQVRICSAGDFTIIIHQVRCKIWNKLLP